MKGVSFDEYDLTASVCRESFYQFFINFWSTIIQEELVLNWHIEYLCNDMQKAAERIFANQPKECDRVYNVPPATSKSTLASIMFPAWAMTRMPHIRLICASHTDTLVMDLSRKSRAVVRSEMYQRCFGVPRKFKGLTQNSVIIAEDQDTKGYWATTEGGMRFCATVGGRSPTGHHAHGIIVDDAIDPKRIHSDLELAEANRWLRETLPTRKVDKRVAVTWYIMQRLSQGDPTANRMENKNAGPVRQVILPADDTSEIKPSFLRAKYKDGLLDPVRLPRDVLDAERGLLGEFAYAAQYCQTPIPLGGGMFKVSKINIDTPPAQFLKVVRSWDTAGSLKGAYTAGVKMAKDTKGRLWVLHVKRGRWAPEEREAIIKQTAQMDGRNCYIVLEQQPGSSGKEVAEATCKMLMGYRAAPDRPTGDKTHRAEPFAGQMNIGNVYVPPDQEWLADYIDELQYFPASRYRDQADASSQALKILATKVRIGGVNI